LLKHNPHLLMEKTNICCLSQEELAGLIKAWGKEPYHARQVFKWIYQKGVSDFMQMSDLPFALRQRLDDNLLSSGIKLKEKLTSTDGTEKFLLELKDKSLIEAVVIPSGNRVTACISSQAGCKFACKFCASGVLGFKRNLSQGEIIEQALYLKNNNRSRKITHIVFMGTGEPLDNYANVLGAIKMLNSPLAFNIGARRITISTCGIIPGIERLAGEHMQIELSVSLHSAEDKARSLLMPVNKKYPLRKLISSCKKYMDDTGRQVTFEYILIEGLNSSLRDALRLSELLGDLRLAKVNLIPSNSIRQLGARPAKKKDVLLFRDFILKNGINVTLRKARGQDIEGACGQLRIRHEE